MASDRNYMEQTTQQQDFSASLNRNISFNQGLTGGENTGNISMLNTTDVSKNTETEHVIEVSPNARYAKVRLCFSCVKFSLIVC